MKNIILVAACLVFPFFTWIFGGEVQGNLFACTSILVTKGASQDGSTMITYTADAAGFYPRLTLFPATENGPETFMDIPATDNRPAGKIRLPEKTFQMIGFVSDDGYLFRQGCINEYQVAISETTFGGREELVNPHGLLNYSLLMTLALQQSKTARETIDAMIRLVDEYGYSDEGESISIADKEEVWVFEIVGIGPNPDFSNGGAIWVARQVPDGEISVHANQARISTIPDANSDTFFFSDNIKQVAIDKEWYKLDAENKLDAEKDFRFNEMYGAIDAKSKRACETRVWSVFRRAAPSKEFSSDYHRGISDAPEYSWSIKPDQKLAVSDVMALLRDHFEGTPFDMTKGVDAGEYGLPRRWRPLFWKVDDAEYSWERPISTQQTGFSMISQSRSFMPDEVGGLIWYGVDDTYLTCYFPIYCSITDVPKSFAIGSIHEFNWESAWWVFNLVSNYANLKYSAITPEIILVQNELEGKFLAMQKPIEKTAVELMQTDPKLAKQFLTDYSIMQGELVAAKWKKLATHIFTKFNDGYIRSDDGKYPNTGYPDEWLRRVIQERPNQFTLPLEGLRK
ncbi:MAG: dipeptidase [Thermoguttaceae bacterium]